MAKKTLFFTFLEEKGGHIGKIFKKRLLCASTTDNDPFLDNTKI